MKLENAIVYLIGHAGTGKYTIARAIAEKTGARVVDNHLINNPVFSVIAQDGKTPLPGAVWVETMAVRKIVLRTIRALSPSEYSFVFTNCLYEGDSLDRTLYSQTLALARSRKADFFPIHLLCNAASLRLRKNTPERRARFKEIDVSNIEWLLKNREILNVSHPNLLTLDVSDITAEQSTDKILEHVRIRHVCPESCRAEGPETAN